MQMVHFLMFQQQFSKAPLLVGFLGAILCSATLQADPLKQAQQTTQATDQAGNRTQVAVDKLDDRKQQLYIEYRQLLAETEQLSLYNKQMTEIVNNQQNELASIARQISEIENTERGVLPLMSRMLDSLEQFVLLDTPFLLQERTTRIALLQDLLTRADVSVSEKFRRILEAYQVEVEYGRNIEAYRARMDDVTYDFLRVGRVALYRMSKDGQQAWLWHPEKDWLVVEKSAMRDLHKAFKIAQQTAAPDLLHLPLPTLASLKGAN